MFGSNKASSHHRSWKVRPYTVSLETRLAQARASEHQPPMISLHGKSTALPRYDNEAKKYNPFS